MSTVEDEEVVTNTFAAKVVMKEVLPGSMIIRDKITSFIERNYEAGREELVVA